MKTLSFTQDGLIIDVVFFSRTAKVSWKGASDIRDPDEQLNPFLSSLSRDLRGLSTAIDFTAFEYMNSVTLSVFLQFVKDLDAKEIPVTLLFSATKEWQRVPLRCMKAIARTLKFVKVDSQ